ncbi:MULTISPECIES: D-alanyl-D-alanine carboxypeptidase family protein [unclassified Sphingomonas]|uniref:D-alanyl-D-alanine carboxypeptidase family protein n=1 Tax=unclassified Sphingomonas TaxID=196159 RepID=UPI00226A707C|nr:MULTISPECIES: D-alanyl-D-alanine carboxypeptidase family protein [unclassified Sphingomonas]
MTVGSVGRRWTVARRLVAIAALASIGFAGAASAAPVSALVVDANDGETLYSRNADLVRPPASLAKMMTLFLVFDALDARTLRLDDRITMSRHAAAQAPSKLGVPAGGEIRVRDAIRAVAVQSANDVAVALAERLAGSEPAFARAMTARARQLGMRHTRFGNATGLTSDANRTSAADIATLSLAMLRTHRRDYRYFSTRAIDWGHRRLVNHNHLLGRVPGVDGIKTGYTVDAGYNLAASATRRGRRLIAVVMGERSIAARDLRVSNLLEVGFSQP